MNPAPAVAIVLTGPLADTMAHRGMGRLAAVIALPLIGVQPCTASWKVLDEEPVTSPSVRMVAHPKTRLACLARNDPDDRGAIVGVGPMALALLGASAGRVGWGAMGRAFFPPRSEPTRPPQRRCPPLPRRGRWRSAWSGGAAGGYGAVCATAPTRAPGGPSAPPWQSHAAGAPAWPVVDELFRRPPRSVACRSLHQHDSGRPESGPVHGRAADRRSHSADLSSPRDGGGVPASRYKCHRPASW
jgi:hypothetical protein